MALKMQYSIKQDEEYAAVNRNFGGIFLSKNFSKIYVETIVEIKILKRDFFCLIRRCVE